MVKRLVKNLDGYQRGHAWLAFPLAVVKKFAEDQAGMGAVNATQNAMNAVWDVPIRDKPRFLKRRLRSLLMLAVIGGGLFATASASAVASSADSIDVVGRLAAPVASVLVGIGVFTLAFRVLTEENLGWSDVFPGAVVAAVAFQLIGAFYLGHSLLT